MEEPMNQDSRLRVTGPYAVSMVDAVIDENGTFTAEVPKGLDMKCSLDFAVTGGPVYVYRTGISKDGPWKTGNHVPLPPIDRDMTEITVIRYKSPVLRVTAIAEDGTELKLRSTGTSVHYTRPPNADEQDYREYDNMSSSAFGRPFRPIMPDKEFTLTVTADGFALASETLKLSEGAVKELKLTLKRAAPKASDPSPRPPPQPPAKQSRPRPARPRLTTRRRPHPA
jgi:hypothetical protein